MSYIRYFTAHLETGPTATLSRNNADFPSDMGIFLGWNHPFFDLAIRQHDLIGKIRWIFEVLPPSMEKVISAPSPKALPPR